MLYQQPLVKLGKVPRGERGRERFRTLAHRHPKLMGYSFSHQADFIQPEDPFLAGYDHHGPGKPTRRRR